jgi:rhodanese-related sulfurtransferase
VVDKGFIPDIAYKDYYGIRPLAVTEVLIYDDEGRFVLKHRYDEDFQGWHIPGGSLKSDGETIQQACDRHVQMDEVAKGVTDLRIIGAHAYGPGEHPYGFPVINLIACKPTSRVIETDKCQWFREAPPGLIKNAPHARYLEVFKAWFNGDRSSFAPVF